MVTPEAGPVQAVRWSQVAAFRLGRQHLDKRLPKNSLASVTGDIGGAQAQLLPAAQISIWARVKGLSLPDVDSAIWNDRQLVKAWCMRRTMFLIPSDDLALFVRGSALRAEREIRWVLGKGVPAQALERVLTAVLKALDEPTTQSDLAGKISRSMGYKVRYKVGGVGWGNRKKVPWVDFGHLTLPANYLLHLAGARGVYCSGPDDGNESTFVRADQWVPHWQDMPRAEAERHLLTRYLGAHGPSTFSDYAIWTGMTVRDAKRIWSLVKDDLAQVSVDGWSAYLLRDHVSKLMSSEYDEPSVRLLPFFDSFLLGHRSHRNIVDADEHLKVYRPAGWVSPVLLVNGRAAGVWSHSRKKKALEVDVRPFGELDSGVHAAARSEAEDLGRFLGLSEVRVNFR